jgi:predicted DNA-binding protein
MENMPIKKTRLLRSLTIRLSDSEYKYLSEEASRTARSKGNYLRNLLLRKMDGVIGAPDDSSS